MSLKDLRELLEQCGLQMYELRCDNEIAVMRTSIPENSIVNRDMISGGIYITEDFRIELVVRYPLQDKYLGMDYHTVERNDLTWMVKKCGSFDEVIRELEILEVLSAGMNIKG